jgi:hypothetical protein
MNDLPDFMTENEDGSITVALSKGLTVDGDQRTSVTLREPKVSDLLAAKAVAKDDGALHEIVLISNLAEVPPDAIKDAFMRDYTRLQDAVAFLNG